jgi:hypothetical protein
MTGIPARVRKAVLERAAGRCEGCGAQVGTELHHRVYRSRGGRHEAENLVALCGWGNHTGCHGQAHNDGTRLGWAVNSWHDPETIPFHAWDGWCLLSGALRISLRDDEASELMALHGIRTEVA